jgi:hypothetical protein
MKSNLQQVEILNVVSIKFHSKVVLLQNIRVIVVTHISIQDQK